MDTITASGCHWRKVLRVTMMWFCRLLWRHKRKHVSLPHYKFVAGRQEGFLGSSLSIRFFSKALVGEHRALSFLQGMAMILPVDSPLQPRRFVRTLISFTPTRTFFMIFSNMRSYMNLVVLALAARTVSPALSAPTSYGPGYGNLLEFKGRAFLISGIRIGSLGCIPIAPSMPFVVSNTLVPMFSRSVPLPLTLTLSVPNAISVTRRFPYQPGLPRTDTLAHLPPVAKTGSSIW